MFNVKLTEEEIGMLELKGGGSVQLYTEGKNLKLEEPWLEKWSVRPVPPGEIISFYEMLFMVTRCPLKNLSYCT
jgi:hypothetical protein